MLFDYVLLYGPPYIAKKLFAVKTIIDDDLSFLIAALSGLDKIVMQKLIHRRSEVLDVANVRLNNRITKRVILSTPVTLSNLVDNQQA